MECDNKDFVDLVIQASEFSCEIDIQTPPSTYCVLTCPTPTSSKDDFPLNQMYCTISEVQHLLQGLEISNACGPDKILAQMLKYTASSIAPSVITLFNLSIRLHGQNS